MRSASPSRATARSSSPAASRTAGSAAASSATRRTGASARRSARPQRNDDCAAPQYNADDTKDEDYGAEGVAELEASLSSNQGPRGMTLDAAGRALLVGAVDNDVGLVRFTTTGAPDTTFGGGTGW